MPMATTPKSQTIRTTCLACIIVLIVLHTLIIFTSILTFARIRNPKVRLRSITIENLTLNSTNSPSFSVRFKAQVAVKNSNFGYFIFSESKIAVLYRGKTVGTATIPGGRAGARRTKKINVTVAADSEDPFLAGDLNSRKITLSANARLKGKIFLSKIVKKKKNMTATMNCTLDVHTRTEAVDNLRCK